MEPEGNTISRSLRTPRSAAVAGIIFAILLTISLVLLGLAGPQHSSVTNSQVSLALQLVPFAGIAFLWLIGVIRDRMGGNEDQFFATVFLGAGLLFVAMLFVAAGVAEAALEQIARGGAGTVSDSFELGWHVAGILLNTFAMRMAGVFIISTSTIGLRTEFLPRWLALSGYVIAVILLLGIGVTRWVELLFPLWVVLFSVDTLLVSWRPRQELAAALKS